MTPREPQDLPDSLFNSFCGSTDGIMFQQAFHRRDEHNGKKKDSKVRAISAEASRWSRHVPGGRCYLWGIRCQRLSWTLATLGRPHHSCPRKRKNTAELLLGTWPWPRGLHMSVIYRVYPVGLVSCGGTTNDYKFSSLKKNSSFSSPGAGGWKCGIRSSSAGLTLQPPGEALPGLFQPLVAPSSVWLFFTVSISLRIQSIFPLM